MTAPMFPQPPPSVSPEEVMAALESSPLFMKSLPEDAMDDPTISALQSLVFDGTPDEIAQNFKEQGNDAFKERRHRDALGFYTQGIEAKPTDTLLLEALLCNRAACNLELKNYGKVLKDCSTVLVGNPKCSKAYYRSGLALLALERFEEALDCCDRCLLYDQQNKGVQGLKDKALQLKKVRETKEQEKRDRILRQEKEKKQLQVAFQERSLITIPNPKDSTSDNPYIPHFDPEDPTGKTLIMPVFFLYPQHAISDIISHFVEDTPFSAHLAAMFPPEAPPPDWDKNGEYVNGRLSVYAITRRKRLLKVGKNMTLRDVFKASKEKQGDPADGLEVKDGCLTFVVLPRGEVEKKWIEDFKKTRDQSL